MIQIPDHPVIREIERSGYPRPAVYAGGKSRTEDERGEEAGEACA